MKALAMVLTVGVAWGALVLVSLRLLGSGAAPSEPVTPVRVDDTPPTAALREQLLRATWQEIGVVPRDHVWGVLMELGFAKGVATVVALADGTASLYLTNGGGMLGAGARPEVRASAVRLCDAASHVTGETTAATAFPRPAAGRVRFYVLTDGGARTVETDEAPLRAGGHRLSALFTAGQDEIAALQHASGAAGPR
jgi:hypothetical protein